MTAYSNAVRDFVSRYSTEAGPDALLDPHAIAEWAYERGLYKPNARTVIDAIATDIAQVFREEYRVDRNGRRYRAKHATTEKRGTRTIALWGDIDDPNVPHAHFKKLSPNAASRSSATVSNSRRTSTSTTTNASQRSRSRFRSTSRWTSRKCSCAQCRGRPKTTSYDSHYQT